MRANRELPMYLALAAALLLAACEHSSTPFERDDAVEADASAAAFHHGLPDHLNAIVERLWADGVQWEFVRPRPPGLGVPDAIRVNAYQIAPVDADDPLSPALDLSEVGLIRIGARDHVFALPRRTPGGFSGLARTVPVLHPRWNPFISCDAPIPDPEIDGRVAWRMLDPAPPPPCFRVATVYAADLEGDGCLRPLTTVARIERAAQLGLVQLAFPPEPAWPFAIRPITEPGSGRVTVEAPTCVPSEA